MYQYLYYWCSNVKQGMIYRDASPYIGPPHFDIILGKVITYQLQYYIFTLQLAPSFTFPIGNGNLEIAVCIRFSPYLKAKDIDDHILRGKESRGDSTGTAFMTFLKIRYLFYCRAFITAKLDYLLLRASGTQVQSYYLPQLDARNSNNIPGWSAKVDNKLESQQLSVSLGAGYLFEF